ncbi:hypothetical protein LL037_21195 [Clostridium estertheticum]|uniref:hypothetical protein n=1 Tax=Clostridium estertheticum TaxID=238834 RepID=UPI001C0E2B8A|nr:hypothetical protein [Clostridium estertheticum]MBU3198261.1 hypothetical protein [Clostridium estertheticum]MCB2354398.1 hypothetical protein [Clostridium estertheticum]WAG42485.1 hypothetical protein LL065_07365 [Clostridium estertheticum]WAG64952.1 hypothetical protein LL037_21195 [Clostridium estertheticum]
MQNRYVADVGDFGKYGLLRNIAKTNLIIGINWYLTPDESSNEDGKHTSYLQKDEYRKCDEELYYSLSKIILENKRNIDSIQKSNILPNSTIFYNKIIDFHKETNWIHQRNLRNRWHVKALEKLSSSDIVFLDPDNGLQVKSTSLTSGKGNKYIGNNELEDYFKLGKSIIFYNHRERKQEEEYLNKFRKLNEFDAFKNSTIMGLKFRRGTIRDYIFILQPQHVCIVKDCCNSLLGSEWKEHFSLLNI